MSGLFYVSVLIAGVSVGQCGLLDKVELKDVKQILERNELLVQYKDICPEFGAHFTDYLKGYVDCVGQMDESLTVCAATPWALLNCTRPLIESIDNCLPERNRGLPDFILKSSVSILEYMCKSNGELIFEIFNPCMWSDRWIDGNAKFDEFRSRILEENEFPSTSYMCSFGHELRNNLEAHVNKACKNSETRSVAIALHDATFFPCRDIEE